MLYEDHWHLKREQENRILNSYVAELLFDQRLKIM
jgi:hypothetical protein